MTTKREAYEVGYEIGSSIAEANFREFAHSHRQITDRGKFLDAFVGAVCETESDHYRQFSPFEFTAKEFNESKAPDGVWEAYERGVYKGALEAAKECFHAQMVASWALKK
jgi:hypothetical protein